MQDVLDTLSKLPKMCAARLPMDDSPIIIKRGVSGYWQAAPDFDVECYNTCNNITDDQLKAMLAGSMFGWDCPAADPDTYAERNRK